MNDNFHTLAERLKFIFSTYIQLKFTIFCITFLLIAMLSAGAVWAGKGEDESPEGLYSTISRSMERYDYRKAKEAAVKLLDKAENDKQRGTAHFAIGVAELYHGAPGEAKRHLDEAYTISKNIHDDETTGLALNSLGILEGRINQNYSLAQYYFLESLQYKYVEAAAHTNLAELAVVQEDTTGIKHAIAGIEIGKRDGLIHTVYSNSVNLAWQYYLRNQTDSATKYKNQSLEIARQQGYHNFSHIYILESKILEKEGNLNEAKNSIQKAISIAEKEQPYNLPDAYLQLATILGKQGNLDESTRQAQLALKTAMEQNAHSSLPEIYKLLADNYDKAGDRVNALQYLRKSFEALDSANNADRSRMIKERQLILDLSDRDKKIVAAEAQMSQQRRTILFMSISIALAIVLLLVIARASARTRRLYKGLVQRSHDNVMRIEELQERIRFLSEPHNSEKSDSVSETTPAQTADTDAPKETDEASMERSRILYERICRLVEDERLYASLTFTRDMLIERLGTNATYLSKAIKDVSGRNYSQFMNAYRMDEAVRMLSSAEYTGKSLKEIASECGFSSITSFYRTFQSATGLSPANYRETYSKMSN